VGATACFLSTQPEIIGFLKLKNKERKKGGATGKSFVTYQKDVTYEVRSQSRSVIFKFRLELRRF
jgi:hypothetical protein